MGETSIGPADEGVSPSNTVAFFDACAVGTDTLLSTAAVAFTVFVTLYYRLKKPDIIGRYRTLRLRDRHEKGLCKEGSELLEPALEQVPSCLPQSTNDVLSDL